MTDFHLRLKQETVDSIKELAEKESRSISGMARKILEDYFNDDIILHSKETGGIVRFSNPKYFHTEKDIVIENNTIKIPVIRTDKNK